MTSNDHQEELALESIRPHKIWPGRTTLYVREVAKQLACTEQHVINLIEVGRLVAIDISTGRPIHPGKNKIHRQALRVPVSAVDAFIDQSKTV